MPCAEELKGDYVSTVYLVFHCVYLCCDIIELLVLFIYCRSYSADGCF